MVSIYLYFKILRNLSSTFISYNNLYIEHSILCYLAIIALIDLNLHIFIYFYVFNFNRTCIISICNNLNIYNAIIRIAWQCNKVIVLVTLNCTSIYIYVFMFSRIIFNVWKFILLYFYIKHFSLCMIFL